MARIRLLPRDERFFDLFEKATGIGVESARALQQMLEDIERADEYRQKIIDLEHAGDSVIHEVADKLNRTFVTPMDHEDIRTLACRLDDIVDYMHAAAERVMLYHVSEVNPECLSLAKVLVQATAEVDIVVTKLRDLSLRKEIVDHCIEINRLENAGDRVYREALGNMFRAGDLMELMRWKEIFEQIEMAIDACEDLADIIESIIVKHA